MRLRHNRSLTSRSRSRIPALSWLWLFLALVCLSATALAQPPTESDPLTAGGAPEAVQHLPLSSTLK